LWKAKWSADLAIDFVIIIVIIIIIINIIIVVVIISFMQSIYTYIPETNYVPREYNVAAILLLLFMVPISWLEMTAILLRDFNDNCVE